MSNKEKKSGLIAPAGTFYRVIARIENALSYFSIKPVSPEFGDEYFISVKMFGVKPSDIIIIEEHPAKKGRETAKVSQSLVNPKTLVTCFFWKPTPFEILKLRKTLKK